MDRCEWREPHAAGLPVTIARTLHLQQLGASQRGLLREREQHLRAAHQRNDALIGTSRTGIGILPGAFDGGEIRIVFPRVPDRHLDRMGDTPKLTETITSMDRGWGMILSKFQEAVEDDPA